MRKGRYVRNSLNKVQFLIRIFKKEDNMEILPLILLIVVILVVVYISANDMDE